MSSRSRRVYQALYQFDASTVPEMIIYLYFKDLGLIVGNIYTCFMQMTYAIHEFADSVFWHTSSSSRAHALPVCVKASSVLTVKSAQSLNIPLRACVPLVSNYVLMNATARNIFLSRGRKCCPILQLLRHITIHSIVITYIRS